MHCSACNGPVCQYAYGGNVYGSANLASAGGNIFLGSGGGTEGGENSKSVSIANTGNGGGIIIIFANSASITGSIQSNGGAGLSAQSSDASGMGGGSGGAVYLTVNALSASGTVVQATGGAGGGAGGWCGANGGAGGGSGGNGRVKIDYRTLNGAVWTSSGGASISTPTPGSSAFV